MIFEKDYNQFQQMVQSEIHQNEGVRAQYRLELGDILGHGANDDGLDNDLDGIVDNQKEKYEADLKKEIKKLQVHFEEE